MLVLSLNLRGTGGILKLASVRSVLDRTRPNIVFLQETLVNADKARCFFQLLRPKWLVCAVNSAGTSGGLLAAWDPSLFNLVPYLTYGGILLTGYCLASKRFYNLLNTYGSCTERKSFWEKVENSGLLSLKNLVLAGDLNLTLNAGESWGSRANLGTLHTFFTNIFSNNNLVDIQPGKLVPTWRNGRVGEAFIAKRLDRFLLSEDLVLSSGIFRSWVDFPFISDHAPILLQLELPPVYKAIPFKFNPVWRTEKILLP
jgi:endonuclease/exonuclease/phosphatase family metal-dependent hydrolase